MRKEFFRKCLVRLSLLVIAKKILQSVKPDSNRFILCDPIFNPHKSFSFCCLFSSFSLAAKMNAKPLFLYERKINKKELGMYRILNNQTISVEEVISEVKGIPAFKKPGSLSKVYTYTIGGLPVGRCIWDEALWNKKSTLLKVEDAIPSIKRATSYYYATKQILQSKNIVGGFFTHTTGVMSGISIRVLLANKIPIFSAYGSISHFKKTDYFDSKTGYVKIPTAVSRDFLKKNEGSNQLKKASLYLKRTFPIIGNNNGKQKWLVAMHAFSDTPNGSLQYIFKDYDEWFHFTLREIKKSKSTMGN